MKTNEVKKLSKDINDNLLELIDLKIDNDMEKVLNKIQEQNVELKRIEDNFNTKFNMIIWAIGVLIALIIGLKVFA
jgi:DNA topoisomerase IA